MSDEWLHGYLEAEVSFGIYLNLLENGNQRRLVLKPYILIQAKSRQVVEYLKQLFGFETRITDKKEDTNVLNALRLQRFDDIDKVVAKLEGHRFVDNERQAIYDRFVKAYRHIKRIGHIWKEWDPAIGTFIDECMPLQQHKRRKYDMEQWKHRIKQHFSGNQVGTGHIPDER